VSLRAALRLGNGKRLSATKSCLPLRIRGSRYLQLSASAVATKQNSFQQERVTEFFPSGLPVPENFTKIRIVKPIELKKGRIVVVGDVHGCYEEFCELLEVCEFNKDKDNLIMVGDLVNKGPDSLKVLKKAMKLNAIVVRGNHEDKALDAYYAYARGEEIVEKYEWVRDLKKKHVAYLEALPFAVKLPSHKLIVVHAGLVPGTKLQDQDMYSMYSMRDLRKCVIRDSWIPLERKIQESIPWASQWQGPEHVIFGHDSSRRLQVHPFATGIDTGAVGGDLMTACVFPPVGQLPNPTGHASRENLGMERVTLEVDGSRKMIFPKTPAEMARNSVVRVTESHNLCLDMYTSFEEKEPAAIA